MELRQNEWTELDKLNGIGPAIQGLLHEQGFYYCEDLLSNSPSKIAKVLDPIDGLTEANLATDFIPQARFYRIKDIDSELVDHLISTGILSYWDFALADTDDLCQILNLEKVDVLTWQHESSIRSTSATVLLELFDFRGDRISNAQVEIASPLRTQFAQYWRYNTNSYGRCLIEFILPGHHEIAISAEGCEGMNISFYCTINENKTIRATLAEGDGTWHKKAFLNSMSPDTRHPFERRKLDSIFELIENGPVILDNIDENDLRRFSSILPYVEGVRNVIEYAFDENNEIPDEIALNTIVTSEDGTLIFSTEEADSYRYNLLFENGASE